MPRPSRLILARNDILSLFAQTPQRVYSQKQLADVLHHSRHIWHLAASPTVQDFIGFLTKHGHLRARRFRSKAYGQEITRYAWREVSPYEMAMSLKARAYFSHATAVTLHGLAKPGSKTIYLNVEQSPKPSNPGSLTQDGIKLAFSRKQRQSNLTYAYPGISITILAGKNTNRLGVEQISGIAALPLPVTNIERTLIDVVVRPAYAGGIVHLLNIYRAAKDRISVERLLETLKSLDYVYP
jgi:predicted transcriptional regulator of viral defense system